MSRQSRIRGRWLLWSVSILAMGCAGGRSGSADQQQLAGDTADAGPQPASAGIRFAIELDGETAGPIYVQLNGEDGQVGWARASRDGERVYLRERCEIEDCGVDPAVCGAAIPLIRDIAGAGDGRGVEYLWDGSTSAIDATSGCESRRPALPGNYLVRFCYSREAEFEGGDVARAAQGRLIDPTCVERAFTLDEQEVVLRI
jgi:hypothetical protein